MAKGVVSSRPADAISGGLLNDADVEIIGGEWCHYDYGGKSDARFCAAITMAVLVDGNPADEHLQYYGAGKAADWIPDPADGNKTPLKTGNATALNNSSNWIAFVDSLITAGVPESKFMDSDLSELIGLRIHVIRKATNRQGMKPLQGGSDREQTVLICDHLVKPVTRGTVNKPGTRTAAAQAQATATTQSQAPAQSAPATDIGDPTETVSGILGELLAGAPDRTLATIALQAKAATKINSLVKEPSARQAYTQALKAILNSDDLLANIGAMADRAANKISLAGE